MSRVQFIRACVFVLLFTLALGLQVRAAATNKQPQAKADLVVMSFNIRYGGANDGENNWDKRKDLACDLVRRQAPDLIGLQEALRSQIDDIRAALRSTARLAPAGTTARPGVNTPRFFTAKIAST